MPDSEMSATLATIESWADRSTAAYFTNKRIADRSVDMDTAVAEHIDFLETARERLLAHLDRVARIGNELANIGNDRAT